MSTMDSSSAPLQEPPATTDHARELAARVAELETCIRMACDLLVDADGRGVDHARDCNRRARDVLRRAGVRRAPPPPPEWRESWEE